MKIRWPQKNDNPFPELSNESSGTFCDLEQFCLFGSHELFLSEGFKKAADKIIESLEKEKTYFPTEAYLFPVAYLYRHAIELQLKSIINFAIKFELVGEKAKEDMLKHNLHKLWNHAKKIIVEIWPEGSTKELNNAEKIILKFHEVDASGENFRYAKNKKGNSTTVQLPRKMDLIVLKDVAGGIYNFLNGCELGISDVWDSIKNEY